MVDNTSPPDVPHILNLLRGAALMGQVSAIAIGSWVFGPELPWVPMSVVSLLYLGWVLLAYHRLTRAPAAPFLFAREAVVDLSIVATLLFFAGGWTNPFTSVLLVPLAFAAATLPARYALGVGAYALLLYALLVRYHVPLPPVAATFGNDFNVHVMGMWASFVLSTCVLVSTVAALRSALERQRQSMSSERELRLRDDQLLAIGALAASAAHELSTPLASARLIAEEFEDVLTGDLQQQASVLGRQLDHANERLQILVRGALEPDELSHHDWARFIDQLCARFALLRPDADLRRSGDVDFPLRVADPQLLESALLGLLINAADASARARAATHAAAQSTSRLGRPLVGLEQQLNGAELKLMISDCGDAMPFASTVAGRQPMPSRTGLGVGLMITSSTIERLDGRVSYETPKEAAHPFQKTVVVSLPLARLTWAYP